MLTPRSENPGLAAGLILMATAFIAGSITMAKLLGSGALGPALHPLQVSQGRFMWALALFATAALIRQPAFGRVHWRLHIGRSTFGWGGVTLMFAAVAYIPMADATAISFLNPVFAMALAIPLLGERVGPVRWTAALIALVGAMVLLRPTPASFQPAALLALGAAAVIGMELVGAGGRWRVLVWHAKKITLALTLTLTPQAPSLNPNPNFIVAAALTLTC